VTDELPDSDVHSFIIKLWLEESSEETGSITWHGYITHVPSGQRRYLKDLDGIIAFVAPYLEAVGVKGGMRRRVKRWLKRAKP
jgi:hypothetical protein